MGCFPQHTDMSACSYAQACGNCCSGLSWLLWDRDGPVDPAALRAELAAMPTEELTKMLEQMEENVQVRVVDGGNAQTEENVQEWVAEQLCAGSSVGNGALKLFMFTRASARLAAFMDNA
eukprot:1159435-Pelagomonas_calceolata.AAC.8